ncbi:MAG: 4Fe-4S dicluster domain-containing protein [Bacteroidota bacterium]|nr:4Fe-4S dicluster domain-containing protein [Bacteroidota bacterium]MDP4205643.1 4Fe-4S dicluster domain-containing protein [Bacteroidota bacterium]
MGRYFELLSKDVRFEEGLNACMNCGVCTAVCPAAEFYNYDPRQIVDQVQSRDDETIESLLKSDTIWYCGECMSCKPRCPRNNTPAYVIQALRTLSQKLGFFTESEKGRQQLAIKRTIGQNILSMGYCVHPSIVKAEMHPEQGPVWEWITENAAEVFERVGGNYNKQGPGAMRKIDDETLGELEKIFEVSGGSDFYDLIERFSRKKALEMGMDADKEDYFMQIYTANNGQHSHL